MIIKKILHQTDQWFEGTLHLWESRLKIKFIGSLLIIVYLAALAVIEAGRRGLLPQWTAAFVPASHYHAISIAFTFLLYIEMIDLVFGLARSFSDSIGKQFQIFALILLRSSFKEFAALPEPLHWPALPDPVLHILSNSTGALIIFGILVIYYKILRHQPITEDQIEAHSFISAKKAIALILLALFFVMGIDHAFTFIYAHQNDRFFDTFYTILVFCDILIVLLSLRYSSRFEVVFRNSGFALATVVLRLALSAPSYLSALLGIGAVLYVLGLTWIYNAFVTSHKRAAIIKK